MISASTQLCYSQVQKLFLDATIVLAAGAPRPAPSLQCGNFWFQYRAMTSYVNAATLGFNIGPYFMGVGQLLVLGGVGPTGATLGFRKIANVNRCDGLG